MSKKKKWKTLRRNLTWWKIKSASLPAITVTQVTSIRPLQSNPWRTHIKLKKRKTLFVILLAACTKKEQSLFSEDTWQWSTSLIAILSFQAPMKRWNVMSVIKSFSWTTTTPCIHTMNTRQDSTVDTVIKTFLEEMTWEIFITISAPSPVMTTPSAHASSNLYISIALLLSYIVHHFCNYILTQEKTYHCNVVQIMNGHRMK